MTENSDETYERGVTLHSACLCCEHAADEIERLRSRVQHLEERLEITYAWQCTGEDPELKRIEIPPEERDSFPDGITCRDETIKLLEEQNERQAARIRVAKRALEPFANIPSLPLNDAGTEMATYFWAVIGTPDRRHFSQTDLVRARAALQRDDGAEPSRPHDETAETIMSESKIIKGLEDALAYAQGDKSKGRSTVYVTLAIGERRDGEGLYIRGMGELRDVYVAGANKADVFADLGPVLQKILKANHGIDWVEDEGVKENAMDEKTLTVSMSERTWDEMQAEHEAAKAEIRTSALDEAIKIADDRLREINARGTWDDKDRHTNDGAAAAAQEIGNALRALKKGECDAG
jgi:hypothetical protein